MPAITDQAVVLRRIEFSESSQILALFGRASGQLRLIAKGARRSTKQRFAAGIDLLELGELSYVPARDGAELGTLTEWVQRDTFVGLRSSLLALHGAMYAAELTGGLTEVQDPHPGLFDALVGLLRELSGGGAAPAAIVRFVVALLREVGYVPELAACVDCRRPIAGAVAYFSSRAGGILCRDCEMHHVEKRRLPHGLLGRSPDEAPLAWFELLDYHVTSVLGRRPALSEPLLGLLRRP